MTIIGISLIVIKELESGISLKKSTGVRLQKSSKEFFPLILR